jgi:phosphoribosylaminoimidazolecarboxamide formyltransferase/IMP cyclohydrolase
MNFVQSIDDAVAVRNVLISVYDKRGLQTFVPELLRVAPGLQIYSTGGSYAAIADILGDRADGQLFSVSQYTGQPEMQGGLVKTLDFKIYLGLLSESRNPAHERDLRRTSAVSFDMVVVNLYPFTRTVEQPGATPERARANIDIGGPCMLRAAAKNFLRVAAVVERADYEPLVRELAAAEGRLSLKTRFRLAQRAFAYSAAYDGAIAGYLAGLSYAQVQAGYPEIR